EYFSAKARLFEMAHGANIINIDDAYGRRLVERASQGNDYNAKLVTYGIEREADVYATNIEQTADYTLFTAHTPGGSFTVRVHLPGIIYVYYSLAAIACAYMH